MGNKNDAFSARTGLIDGRVQGVGFRFFAARAAAETGVAGWVRNLDGGAVEFFAQGDPARVKAFVDRLRQGPGHAEVTDLMVREALADPALRDFEIRH